MSDEKIPITDVFGNVLGYVGGSGMGCCGLLLIAPLAGVIFLGEISNAAARVVGQETVDLFVILIMIAIPIFFLYKWVRTKEVGWGIAFGLYIGIPLLIGLGLVGLTVLVIFLSR